ncbi:TPM domain-containing protein [Corynebacterium sp. AOP40-9SA-29]|uniref:TPM domain-containing protein n=1 Tax=Corynebacterium sp. AOP40-9SA-29 TaxID=3457677 RepID=UPI0040349F30
MYAANHSRNLPRPSPSVRLRRFAASVAVAGVAGAGLGLGLGAGSAAAAPAQDVTQDAATTVLAQGTATDSDTSTDITLDSQVVDQAGVLSDSERSSIEETLADGPSETGVRAYLVYTDSAPTDLDNYAEELRTQRPANDTLVVVIDTQERNFATSPGTSVPDSVTEDVNSAIRSSMGDGWASGGQAIADVVADVTPASTYAWGGAAAVVVVGGAGGAIWYSRKKKHENEAEQLESARTITPDNTDDLSQQPTHVLRTLASEELHSTDESIRKGHQELDTAEAEFGEERTRDLRKALEVSKKALARAYDTHQRLQNGLFNGEHEERAQLIDIISSCGTADDNLDEQAERFATLREKLIDAPEIVEKFFQQTVELRSRIPRSREILENLSTKVDPELLESVADNPDIAEAEITEAEQAITRARELLNLPAGQQGELIDAAGSAHLAIKQADSQLSAVEHAESQLHEAQASLDSLIQEVDEEITEATHLAASNAEIDRAELGKAVERAKTALAAAREKGDKDPLGTYSELLDADGELDIQLDEARGAENNYQRTLGMVDRTIADATNHLRAVEDTIHTRGRMIGVEARSAAQSAGQALDAAHQQRDTKPRAAFTAAQQANALARQASQLARRDIEEYNRRNNYYGRGGGGGGNLVAGVVLGSLLSGNGGFGGGFGGGGGGFGGGGGGGFGGGGDFGSF